jgi:thioredoxin 1
MSPTHFTDSNFKKEVLESRLPVMVDFWANWCGPCKMIAPIVEQLTNEFKDKVKIGKIDVDVNPKTATTYGIMSIPTLMFFKGGKVTDQVVGVLSLSEVKKKIEEIL